MNWLCAGQRGSTLSSLFLTLTVPIAIYTRIQPPWTVRESSEILLVLLVPFVGSLTVFA
ncbi:hypothetical protein [Paenibacillus sp. FSL L8-0638]|uniref:hypothetical protein n=1 Tax=Paenibacillus sp. FSL L8-0638 TaxID=2921604 RepID=UPI003158E586